MSKGKHAIYYFKNKIHGHASYYYLKQIVTHMFAITFHPQINIYICIFKISLKKKIVGDILTAII